MYASTDLSEYDRINVSMHIGIYVSMFVPIYVGSYWLHCLHGPFLARRTGWAPLGPIAALVALGPCSTY